VGRRKKFGEESGFVNVRVPKSKVSEYRAAINKLVNEKFSRDSCELNIEEGKGSAENKTVTFRDFREFGSEVEKGFYVSEFYSSSQKIKYIKSMLESFFEYYTQFIHDNFFFIRN